LNYEAVQNVSLVVAVTDSADPAMWSIAEMTVDIANVNDAPVLANQSFSVREYLNSGSVVGTMSATDEDAGQTVTYSIESTSLPGVFMIDPSNGNILVQNGNPLDYETVTSVTLLVRATDSGNPAKSTTATVTVAINDVNESPMMSAQTYSVAENAANGTVVGTVLASDVDAGQSLNYEIFASPVPGAFAINAATGQITVANGSLLDFESRSSIELAILVSDNGSPVLGTFAPITINLTNVNEAPVVTPATFSINENSANGVMVGTVTATDPDAGQTRTFAITAGNTGNAFSINAATGALTVNNAAALNFEVTPSFTLTVTATDNGTPVQSGSAAVTINLNNVNEAPVVTAATFSINENSSSGTAVGTVTATDPDAGQTRTYSITAGNTNNAFSINAATGALTVNNSAALNFEANPTFSLTITATDNGTPVKSGSATVTVNLTNVNEAPVISSQTLAVKTKSKDRTVVGTVVSTDPDAGQTRTYSIVSGNTGNTFAINSSTGVVTVNNSNGVKAVGQYDLVIRVTDNGSPALSATGTVRIYVNSSGAVPAAAPLASPLATQSTSSGLVTRSLVDGGTQTTATSGQGSSQTPNSGNSGSSTARGKSTAKPYLPLEAELDELFATADLWR
jgi:VCBS repeat-containing protein